MRFVLFFGVFCDSLENFRLFDSFAAVFVFFPKLPYRFSKNGTTGKLAALLYAFKNFKRKFLTFCFEFFNFLKY